MKMIDFTNCRRLLGRAYNGANGKKIAIEYNGEPYMLKFPPSGVDKPTALSYTNSSFSEHLASSIFNMLGINAQKTVLGIFNVGGKSKVVCACKDFTEGGRKFFDFCSIKNTVLDSDSNGSGTELDDVMETIEKQTYINPQKLKDFFWDMFVADALLGNFDRHNGNWGFLFDEKTNETTIAPVYDCGSCLLPQADEKIMQKVLTVPEEMDARIYQFPTSALKGNGKKINYQKFLNDADNEECNAAVLRIVPKINMKTIASFIDDVPGLTDLQKEFYKTYISARYERILLPAYDLILAENQEQDAPQMML